MTILQESPQRGRHARKGQYTFGRRDQAARHTAARDAGRARPQDLLRALPCAVASSPPAQLPGTRS